MSSAPMLYWGAAELLPGLAAAGYAAESVPDASQFAQALSQGQHPFALIDAREAAGQRLVDALVLPAAIPLLVLVGTPVPPAVASRFRQRQLADLLDARAWPDCLDRALVLLPESGGGAQALMQLKNQALSQLYHQLQGPVTALEGYLEILQSEPVGDESTQQIFTQLRHCVWRLRQHFNSLHVLGLVSAQLVEPRLRAFPFHQLLADFRRDFDLLQAMAGSSWDLQLDAQSDLVLSDPSLLLDLLTALLDLALRAGNGKSAGLTLQTANLSAERLASRIASELEPGQYQRAYFREPTSAGFLQVSLQLRGVRPELFQTLKHVLASEALVPSGEPELVLAALLTRQILSAHAAWISLEQQGERGLLFSFVLPLHQPLKD